MLKKTELTRSSFKRWEHCSEIKWPLCSICQIEIQINLPAHVHWGIIASRESLAWKVEIGDSSVLFRCECNLNLHLKENLECPKCGSTGQDNVCQEKSDDLTTFLPKYSRRTRCRWIWYIPGRNTKNKIHFTYDNNYVETIDKWDIQQLRGQEEGEEGNPLNVHLEKKSAFSESCALD